MKLPIQNGRWQVKHGKDYFADIVRTKNLSFDKDGFVSLARKPMALYTSNDDSGFGRIFAIVPDDSQSGIVYVLTDNNDFVFTPNNGTLVKFTNSHTTADQNNDAVFFKALLHSTTTSKLQSYSGGSGGTWTDRVTGLSTSYPHPIAVFEDRVEISIGNGNTVQNYNTSYVNNATSAPYTLTLPAQYVVTCLRWRGGRMYIATRHIYGGEAMLFIWDGASTSTGPGYGVGANTIFSMQEYAGSMALVTSAGQLLSFNGAGFTELAHFPIYDKSKQMGSGKAISTSNFDSIPNRGMCRVGNRLFINAKCDSLTQNAYDYAMPSGVWCYDPAVGLYHRGGYQHNKYQTLTISSLDSHILTVGTHGLATGDPVYAKSVSNITGLSTGNIYYAIVITTTTIQLALSRVAAVNGKYLALTGTPSGDTLAADDQSAYGATFDSEPGAIGAIPSAQYAINEYFGTSFIYGCRPADDTETSVYALNGLGLMANHGYLVTTPMPASGIQDIFQKLFFDIQQLNATPDALVVKYRTVDRFGFPTPSRLTSAGLATWTSTTTFTVDTTKKDVAAVQVGDEVEMVSGSASGMSTKITAIDDTTSTYTFTVEDTMPVSVSDKSEVMFDNWTVLGTYTSTTQNVDKGFIEQLIGMRDSLIQLKIELHGYDTKFRTLDIITKADKQAV